VLGYSYRMPETPEQFWERVRGDLQVPPLEEWDTWPFAGDVTVRPLQPPVELEKPRHGEGGHGCRACAAPDDSYIWKNERWRLRTLDRPSGLPVVVLLEPRAHFSAPGDLPEELAAELGILTGRIERAVRGVEGVGLVHVLRYGEGSEHLHVWFMARPARMEQLRSSFAAVWDDVLPPTPDDLWRANLDLVVGALGG
jgi:diadenosine tetraphosphate (Ap4A) HIT family hydrolase